jgi:hypothetical protein
MQFIIENKAVVLGALLAVSELLDAIPQLKASSIWKLVFGAIKSLVGKNGPAA